MTHSTSISGPACAPGALPGGPTRTQFFDGMFLTQSDLETEQRFWRIKRRLTNRALGDGVVWGLRVAWDARRRVFSLSPGYALDCCGNDLVVECPVEISETELWGRSDPGVRPPAGPGPKPNLPPHLTDSLFARRAVSLDGNFYEAREPTRTAAIVLQYTECAEDSRPVHRDACGGATNNCEPSRVRETSRLLLVPPPVPQLTPPEKFVAELEAWRASLPANIRDLIFPPQAPATTTPTTGLVPMHVIVTVPGTPPSGSISTKDIQPLATGTVGPGHLIARQLITGPAQRTAVVTFELRPSSGWGFTAGRVLDGTRTVETVTPPVAPSMYWALDVVVPDGSVRAPFEFVVDNVDVAELFGGTKHGRVILRIRGVLSATPVSTTDATVEVHELTVTTEKAEVVESTVGRGCLRELVPWGWVIDPVHTSGRKIAGSLVLSSLYALLSEVTTRGASAGWSKIAPILYTAAWYAIYGVRATAPVGDAERKKLAEMILDLYRRWCEGMAYPGPRCVDEHHGVYLGTVELDRSGRIQSFDMWKDRRYVVTGAILEYWARQFGIAPIDVVVGRFARAICCLSGVPPIMMPPMDGRLSPGIGGDNPGDRVHVGTTGSVTDFAKLHGRRLTWVPVGELSRRANDAFLRRDVDLPLEVVATQLVDGGSIALVVPAEESKGRFDKLRLDITTLLRRGQLRTPERSRPIVADFAIELLRRVPAASFATPNTSRELVARLESDRVTVADLIERGSESFLAGAPAAGTGIDELVARAEDAVDEIVTASVKTLPAGFDRKTFDDAEVVAKLGKQLARGALANLPADAVSGAAGSVSRG